MTQVIKKAVFVAGLSLCLATVMVAQTPDSVKTAADTLQDSPEVFLADMEKFVAALERQAQIAPMKEAHQKELWEALQKRKKNLIEEMTPKQKADLRHLEDRYSKIEKSVSKG